MIVDSANWGWWNINSDTWALIGLLVGMLVLVGMPWAYSQGRRARHNHDVSRLQAEADRKEALIVSLLGQVKIACGQRDAVQSELAQARESMLDVVSNLGEFCCGLDSQEQVDYITSQLDILARQSAPAAKDGK